MKTAREYLAQVKAGIALSPRVKQWIALREEAQGTVGMLRYRLTLDNDDLLEVFEYFRILNNEVVRVKYSYYWQDARGRLMKRWDNAAHHPEIPSFPHHMHTESEDHVLPHQAMTIDDVLDVVAKNREERRS
ncbi:MAG: DUF6516 family protein [Anaerolineae bacterium]|nr:DUF6516 family protein [Anaerolineae bacterium]